MYGLRVITPPAVEPVTLAEAKAHIRSTLTAEDVWVTSCIKASRSYAEQVLNRAILPQTLDYFADAFPGANCKYSISLPMAPLQSISSVKYYDEAGVLQTLAATQYQVDISQDPGRVRLASGSSWPTIKDQFGAVQIRFIAGYADVASIPEEIVLAIKLLIGHFDKNREDTISGTIIAKIPTGVDALLWPHRVWTP